MPQKKKNFFTRICLLTREIDRDDLDEEERTVTIRPKPSGPASPFETPAEAAGNSKLAAEE